MTLAPDPRRPAAAGFTLIELMIVIAIIAIIAAIAIPNLIEGRKGANEAAAISTLRSIYTAEQLFRDRDMDRNGKNDYADQMTELAGLLPDTLTGSDSPETKGYRFFVLEGDEGPDHSFRGFANPISPGKSGDRYFFVDDTGVIRANTTGQAASDDQAIGK